MRTTRRRSPKVFQFRVRRRFWCEQSSSYETRLRIVYTSIDARVVPLSDCFGRTTKRDDERNLRSDRATSNRSVKVETLARPGSRIIADFLAVKVWKRLGKEREKELKDPRA